MATFVAARYSRRMVCRMLAAGLALPLLDRSCAEPGAEPRPVVAQASKPATVPVATFNAGDPLIDSAR